MLRKSNVTLQVSWLLPWSGSWSWSSSSSSSSILIQKRLFLPSYAMVWRLPHIKFLHISLNNVHSGCNPSNFHVIFNTLSPKLPALSTHINQPHPYLCKNQSSFFLHLRFLNHPNLPCLTTSARQPHTKYPDSSTIPHLILIVICIRCVKYITFSLTRWELNIQRKLLTIR